MLLKLYRFVQLWLFLPHNFSTCIMSSKPAIMKDDKLPNELQQTFIRKAQKINEEKLAKSNMIKTRNRLSGLFMAVVVGSIYAYTLLAVKQEKFLDELDDPEPVPKK